MSASRGSARWKTASVVAALVLGAVSGRAARTQEPAPARFDPATLKPFTEITMYLDKYQTGLYPDGKNEIPAAHRTAGERVAAAVRPLDVEGKPDPAGGRILAVVMGHSNCNMYFNALQAHLKQHAGELNPRFEMLNAAVGGQQLPQIRQLAGPVWTQAERLLSRPGYSAKQVQVLFLHTTWHGAGNRGNTPPEPFPDEMKQMQKDLALVLGQCVKIYPNLRIACLTCDGFRHFTGFEPHVWREAFAFKWLIESQIKGEEGTAFEDKDGKTRALPWLEWGPYIWDNAWDRSFFTDGVHPAPKARDIFVNQYWKFLAADPVARPWLWKDGKPPTIAP